MSLNAEPIAIIGTGCRFPGESSTSSKLWDLLHKPRDVAREIDRFSADGFYHEDGHHHGTSNVRHSYLLSEDHRVFDAEFFNVKPVEAESIDPMQRILLEIVYESLEDAGVALESLRGSDTACYVGVMTNDYADLVLRDIDCLPTYTATGTSRSILSNRISYTFDWHGPSMTIDTACSSSLVALHLAVQTIRSGESRVAVAGGANLLLGPECYNFESKLNMLSPTGRSRMWDKDVDGYARGDGIAAVVMKKLSDAIADGDMIECVIRETGTNQDGATAGITMPSPSAQAKMIRDAYTRAGLDLNKIQDRPQYFEAHGTGTKAGDPVEAEAIYNAFFGPDLDSDILEKTETLHVGSIKTVIGHTEGTAGLAAVLKAALALKNAIIPPNLLFKTLNPALEPFYGPLRIPTEALPWPKLPIGAPRRASVNSFGFGGSNAHAILEAYTPVVTGNDKNSNSNSNSLTPAPRPIVPFVFSAVSEKSLQKTLLTFWEYLHENPQISVQDLAWTLHARRSALPVKITISASTREDLSLKLDEKLQVLQQIPNSVIGVRTSNRNRRILGVFTGQGAQWPKMGKALLDTSAYVNNIATELEASLQELPAPDRPSFSLIGELYRDSKSSRIQEAVISQPLCTFIQIILVDLLRVAGIEFSSVLGHSSGEISAAYAAGYLSAKDALKIAYYRGLYATRALGPQGQKGAMLAVGTSLEDAEELCGFPDFEGRIGIAACNSSSSITLSGDADAIAYAKEVFEDEKKFVRLLKVDTAYHYSAHMTPCSEPYVNSLRAAQITVLNPTNGCVWHSSVRNGAKMQVDDSIKAEYWRDNMVSPVMFSQAIKTAISENDPFQLALEIGPHPALKAPALQNLEDAGATIPYAGVLSRGNDDVEAFADGLGFVWANLGPLAANLDAFDRIVSDEKEHTFLKGLPSYSWDHEKVYWYESRKSKLFRAREQPPHELLGVRCDDSSDVEFRWRNFLSPKEVPWLSGHQVQGQIVFPAAGYVSMALEAAQIMAKGEDLQLLEIENLIIDRAIIFNDENTGVETTFSLYNIVRAGEEDRTIVANFSVASLLAKNDSNLSLVGRGTVKVILGKSSKITLPPKPLAPAHLLDVDVERFYEGLSDVGYGYTGPFRALSNMKRRLNFSTGLVERPTSRSVQDALLVHPALLDPAFQALLAGYSWPGDGRLWTLHLPTTFGKIRVNPSLGKQRVTEEVHFPFNATLVDGHPLEIRGDVDIFAGDAEEAFIQIEDIGLTAVAAATPNNDRPFFSETVWGVATPNAEVVTNSSERATPEENALGVAIERVSYYYWRMLDNVLSPKDRQICEIHHKRLLAAISYNFSLIDSGKHPYVKKEWKNDSKEFIHEMMDQFSSKVDMKLSKRVGEALPAVIRGEVSMLEQMRPDGMLDDFYQNGLGFPTYNTYLARVAKQLTHRFPRSNILEIAVLNSIGSAFSFYTYTDITNGFFEAAVDIFKNHTQKMKYKTLDIENDPVKQGFELESYDLIIASNVLHATAKLENTLKNVRSLLKPGGYLLLLEITEPRSLRFAFMMGGLSGWWLGADDGRVYSPCVTPSKWNLALRKAGLSGVDTITPQRDPLPHPFSIITAQASDDRVAQLKRPLSAPLSSSEPSSLYLLGGQEIDTANLVEDLSANLGSKFRTIVPLDLLEDFDSEDFIAGSTVVSLLDVDSPVLKGLTSVGLRAMQQIFEQSKNILWITRGSNDANPYGNASVGLLRSVASELPHLRIQTLDFDDTEKFNSQLIAECVMRLQITGPWERDDPSLKDRLLWSTEPELSYREGKLFVPRVLQNRQNNDRLNSQRRKISFGPGPSVATEIYQNGDSGDSWAVRQDSRRFTLPSHASTSDTVTINMSYSSLWAARLFEDANLFVGIGHNVTTNDLVIAIATERSSVIETRRDWSVLLPTNSENQQTFLELVMIELLAFSILLLVPDRGTLLAHEPSVLLASALTRRAISRDISVNYTSESEISQRGNWIYLHPRAAQRLIKQKIPQTTSTFVDFTSSGLEGLGSRISSCLPSNCKSESFSSLFQKTAAIRQGSSNQDIGTLFGQILSELQTLEISPTKSLAAKEPISLREIQDNSTPKDQLTLIDWTTSNELPLEIAQLQPKKMFSKNRTYLLVGLTGQTGKSLCQWMARNGAGAIVLTSRSPDINQRWIDELEAAGTTIKVFPLDATNRESLVDLHVEIKQTLPQLGGIANGAMILHDRSFLNMDLDVLNKVLRPKIDASIHLDEIFSDTPLDFFIMFSSVANVVGNRGQSNYSAANMFMASLARQRKSRGLAGSVLNIGRLVGLGYLERAGVVVDEILTKSSFMKISEVDIHHSFAQAIMAGLPSSTENPDIIIGLRPVGEDEMSTVPWASNPRLSHLILQVQQEETQLKGKNTVLSVKAQLKAAKNETEAFEAIESCFSAKLQMILHIPAESFRADAALIELGVDSLVAVDIRSWFLKEVNTDMPVLKIVGGATTTEVCQYALETLPQEMIPNLGGSPELDAAGGTPGSEAHERTDPKIQAQVPETTSGNESQGSSSTSPNALVPSDHQSPGTPDTQESSESQFSLVQLPPPTLQTQERISLAQSRFWFLNLLIEDKTAFNVTFFYSVQGRLRVGDLDRAVKEVGRTHESLRTCFFPDINPDETAWQGIMGTSKLKLEHKYVNTDDNIKAEYDQVRKTEYDLSQGHTMRIVLLSKSETSHAIIFGYHHIIMDGSSFQLFIAALETAYKGKPLTAPALQYPRFSVFQRKALETGKMKNEFAYWRQEFKVLPEVLPLLPMSKATSRRPIQQYGSKHVIQRLDPRLARKIKERCQQSKVTTFHFYLAAFKAILFRFLEIEHLSIGISDANRNDKDVIQTIGLLLNLLPLSFRRSPSQTFVEAIKEARTKVYSALANSAVPFSELLTVLNLPRSSSHSPLFQAFFDYRKGSQEKMRFADVDLEIGSADLGGWAYDIVLDILESDEGSLILFRGQDYMYDTDGLQTLLRCYITLLESFAEDPTIPVDQGRLFSEAQINTARDLGRGPKIEYEWPETLSLTIDAVIDNLPEIIALKDGLESPLSYHQMGQRLNSIASELQAQGVQRGDKVAVFQKPSADLICSLLAIMRVGAVYIPLDLRNATARLAAIVEAAGPKVILSHRQTTNNVDELNYPTARNINISAAKTRSDKVANISKGSDPAFILFTSGSTGVPKGIVLKHSNFAQNIEGFVKQYKVGREIVLQQSAYSFDLSLAEIFTGLAVGGTLIVVPAEKRGDSVAITKLIREEKVTYTEATPSEYSSWIQFGGWELSASLPWKFAFVGGEELKPKHLAEFKSLNHPLVRLYNCWGPTEVTISANKIEIDFRSTQKEDARMPVGFPLPGYAAYVVNEKLELVASGIPGELVISGPGVSAGYLNNEDLTKEKFLPDKFGNDERKSKGWTTMFRTGDRGYLREDGAVVFQGRIAGDTQIKLRGIRIDLLDIEATIVRASEGVIADVIVSVRTEAQFLVAHIVFAKDFMPHDPTKYLKNFIAELPLPAYMRPAFALVLETMPLTIHSKKDRRAAANLPLPQHSESSHFELTPTESQLKSVWGDVISQDIVNLFDIGPDTDFFTVGGNSLLLVKLQSFIRKSFNVALPLATLLDAGSLGRIASKIEQSTVISQIDWIQETQVVPEDFPSKAWWDGSRVTNTSQKKTSKKVILTGASGYLGSRILTHLVKDASVSEVHCIAVRKDATGQFPKFPITSSKIFAYAGDLTAPRLGLSEEVTESLSQSADAIIHCGAKRSFWDNYEQLRETNVTSTKKLVEIAALRKIPIHFFSSGGVLQLIPSDKGAQFEEHQSVNFQPPRNGTNGYVASKWAGETYLENAAGVLGIPISIYRFTPSNSLTSAHPSVLEELSKYAHLANSLPDPAGWEGNFDLVKAESVTQRICTSILVGGNTGTKYIHIQSEIKMDATAVAEYLHGKLGKEIKERLPALEWGKQLERKTNDAALKRAMLGREEAETEMRRYKEEVRVLRRQVDEGKDRERKVGERLENVMENYGRAKETHAHTQTLWEKEIRRARKESFKSQSVVVKLQEEVKSARNIMKSSQNELELERQRSMKREQEAFAARYQLVGVQEELSQMQEKIKLVEQERDALRTIAKNEEIARIAAEGQIPLPVCKDEEFASPKKERKSLEPVTITSSAASEEELEEFKMRLEWERRRANRAQDRIEFLEMECQLNCCPSRASQNVQTKSAQMGNSHKVRQSTTVFIPAEGIFRTIPPGPEESPWISPVKKVLTIVPLAPIREPVEIPSYARTPSCEPPAPALISDPNTSLLSLFDAPRSPSYSPTSPVHENQEEGSTVIETFHTVSTTTRIPLANPDLTPLTTLPVDLKHPALSPTMSREEALAQIRERRGRARSLAQGTLTPRKQMVEGSGSRRDISAPAVRSSNTHAALPSLSPDSPASSENDLFQSPAASDTDPAPPSPSQEVEEGFRNRIPPDLLTRLLHEFFGDNTRVQQDAGKAVGMYIETFIREAVARAAYERMGGLGHGAGNGIGGGFLEVEDLEKLAPQLLLDF
ncbi:hypothetical protein B7494_g1325 [Chlorociboria aeruginascens]|nr:hypothetical protein B7494_g1325 [Chlorociboria aeruginascens]